MSDPSDLILMRRAIAVALPRLGQTWPNPAVGCVLARDGVILAEAATAAGGRPHAEQQALEGVSARGADAYVTLEPCGERSDGTPSCSERLAAAGVRRVFVAAANPDSRSAGRGLDRLKAAGIVVQSGLLEEEAAPLYRAFRHRLRTGLPLLEAAKDGHGFDSRFEPAPHESLHEALRRYGDAGYTRLWLPAGEALAEAATALGLMDDAAGR